MKKNICVPRIAATLFSAWFGLALPAVSMADAPIHRLPSNVRVIDGTGRGLYIVDLRDDAIAEHGNASVDRAVAARFNPRHKSPAVALVNAFERRYRFEHDSMTSWVGLSFAAYLSEQQVAAIRKDVRVTQVSEAGRLEFSAPVAPTWENRTVAASNGIETYTWGHAAIGGIGTANASQPKVYVIDAGVGRHRDLQVTNIPVRAGINPVGCFSHATHVAGIIAATYGNFGVAGVLSGASIISASTATSNNYINGASVCGTGGDTASLGEAIDAVRVHIGSGAPVAVVNISMNNMDFNNGTLTTRLARLATPDGAYNGAFVAQSAGNQISFACSWAYSQNLAPNASDGIMVVGGVDWTGMMVVKPSQYVDGYLNEPHAKDAAGSNFGVCVEAWAPSKSIYSTWGPLLGHKPDDPSTWQVDSEEYGNYVHLSGTSMAAPFVAGIAAAILQQNPLLTPGEVEARIRAARYSLGQIDDSADCYYLGGCPVRLASNPAATIGDNAEIVISQSALESTTGVGVDVVLTTTAHSNGPAAATFVTVELDSDPAANVVWRTPACAEVVPGVASKYRCALGTIQSGGSQSVMLVLRKAAAGTTYNNAKATASNDHEDSNATSTSVTINAIPPGVPVNRYRLYNKVSTAHHFTTDQNEYDVLRGQTTVWTDEGIQGKLLNNPGTFNQVTAVPYYRLFDTRYQWHLWTRDPNEYYTLANIGVFNGERLSGSGYILPQSTAGAMPLYRLVLGAKHHWTTDYNEYTTLQGQGWRSEGIAGFVMQ